MKEKYKLKIHIGEENNIGLQKFQGRGTKL